MNDQELAGCARDCVSVNWASRIDLPWTGDVWPVGQGCALEPTLWSYKRYYHAVAVMGRKHSDSVSDTDRG